MIDLHCHILPLIDDGPSTVEESVALVRMELATGVDTIAVTPHFISQRELDTADFCEKRRCSTELLNKSLRKESVEIKILEAAEVALSPDLLDMTGIDNLKYAGTNYMLIELPCDYYYDWIPQILYNLRLSGVVPILAHVERFAYIKENTEILINLVNLGCLAQINASTIITGSRAQIGYISQLVHRDLIHIVATDAHSITRRPPQLKEAMDIVCKKWGVDIQRYFCENARTVVSNSYNETCIPQETK